MTTRLPSFNDFSVITLNNDIRRVLHIVKTYSGSEEEIFANWKSELFPTWDHKRVVTNITATLGSTGLTIGRPLALSAFGERVESAASAKEAAQIFCGEIIKTRNGSKLIEAIRNLSNRSVQSTKKNLRAELIRLQVTDLANDTTDHTTLKNWMIAAEIVEESRRGFPTINDEVLKSLTGVSSTESSEIQSLTLGQQVFLHLLRRRHLTDLGPFNASELYTECSSTAPHEFGAADFAKAIKEPLSSAGWIEVSTRTGSGRGGKSGTVKGTAKLLSIPIENFIPNFDATVPPDLNQKLQTPLGTIKEWLDGADIHKGGLGLELLSLRIILDLRLTPRGFRVRSKDTGGAEVDVTAEGDHLLFSRWTFQCKRIQSTKNVSLGDVAKEVGMAMLMRAHVIVMVSTGGFSGEAIKYAEEITRASHLQFVFLNGELIRRYLDKGPSILHDFVMKNAKNIMSKKGSQPQGLQPQSSSDAVLVTPPT